MKSKKKFFEGVCTALITPFKDDKIDFEAFALVINNQILCGIDALCILGTTGEASTLSFDEKIEIIKFASTVVKGRIPLVFGIGGNNPNEIIKLGKAVKDINPSAAVMLTAPYYNKCTQDAAVKYFDTVANAVGLPMIVYNVPKRTGMNLEPGTLAKICTNPYIIGIKEASGDMSQIIEAVHLCPVAVYSGDDGLALPCYSVGCFGVISVASNVRPVETRAIWSCFCDLTRIVKPSYLFLKEVPYYNALFCEVNPGPVKYAAHLMGYCRPDLRLPLTQPTDKSIMTHGFRKLFKPTGN